MTRGSADRQDAFAVDPRRVGPSRRLDAFRAALVAAVAVAAYTAALTTDLLPPRSLAVAFFSAAPLLAVVALVVVVARAAAERDGALAWFGAGLGCALAAMSLQFVSFPLVATTGGVLGTSNQSSAALYVLYHLAPAAGAAAGAWGVPVRRLPPALGAGLLLALLLALDVVPLPYLLRFDGTYTPTLVTVEYALAVLVGAAALVWTLRTGRRPQPLRAWIAVSLSLCAYDVLLNAMGAERFTSVWWASLSLRVGTYAVLAVGAVYAMLTQLRDLETYADRELDRREAQLQHSLGLTSQLLSSADDLAAAVTTADVARVLSADALASTAGQRSAVLLTGRPGTSLRAVAGTPAPSPDEGGWLLPVAGLWSAPEGQPLFLERVDEHRAELPGLASSPLAAAGSLAVLPLRAGDERVGLLLVASDEVRPWTALGREVLLGLAAQGSQAIARARAFEYERAAAETLQRSLLPPRLPARADLAMAARYLPGEQGVQVGGDWYDVVEVSDREVALVVGDVMGKGLHAAAVMGQLRTALRALTVSDPSPGAVLHGLDRLTRDLDIDEIATMAYVLLDLETGTARVARAGHLPPLLVVPGQGPVLVEGGGSPPLGAPAPERPECSLVVPPGSLWVLYTDGLVEDRAHGLDRGLPELVETVGRLHAEHGLAADTIATELLDSVGTAHRVDDIALLLAGFTGVRVPSATV